MKTKPYLYIYLAAFFLVASAQAQTTIYQDDFGGLQTDPLNGTPPDIRPGTEVWDARQTTPLAPRDPRADGSFAGGAIGQVSATLPITIDAGMVYTFEIDLTIANPDAGQNQWAGIAFNNSNVSQGTESIVTDSFAALLFRRNGGAQAITTGGSADISIAAGTYGASESLGIVLDTTGATWTADFQIGGVSIGTNNIAVGTNPGTKYLSLGQFSLTSATFDNLSVTAIPEPSSFALLLGLAGLFVLHRRKR